MIPVNIIAYGSANPAAVIAPAIVATTAMKKYSSQETYTSHCWRFLPLLYGFVHRFSLFLHPNIPYFHALFPTAPDHRLPLAPLCQVNDTNFLKKFLKQGILCRFLSFFLIFVLPAYKSSLSRLTLS